MTAQNKGKKKVMSFTMECRYSAQQILHSGSVSPNLKLIQFVVRIAYTACLSHYQNCVVIILMPKRKKVPSQGSKLITVHHKLQIINS